MRRGLAVAINLYAGPPSPCFPAAQGFFPLAASGDPLGRNWESRDPVRPEPQARSFPFCQREVTLRLPTWCHHIYPRSRQTSWWPGSRPGRALILQMLG